ncbi:YciK family oxidoreductase [Celerinatantimonas yamalensis]|uniref:YciK family oxidoreductase n=1 Tax=Celerinatantimonas yamalensis TaxID=559956 RepID=A0ABW9G414_9GAMM
MHFQPQPQAFKDKVILISGASDGLGRCAALHYAQYGADLVLLGRDRRKLEQTLSLIKPFNTQTLAIDFDLAHADQTAYQSLIAHIETLWHRLDGALFSAGILGELVSVIDINIHNFDQVMNINVRSQLLLSQSLLPLLLKASLSSLIFTSSSVGHIGRAGWGSYAISKFAVEGLTQTLADEYHASSLRVNCINPGATRTAMRAQANPQENPLILKTPEDIMPTYLYLMDDSSQSVNGLCLDAQPK